MNCLNCSKEFDAVYHIPRLLPHCGHTICSICINRLINSNFIVCTQCQQLNMAFKQSDLPKNLAILRIQTESRRNLIAQHQQKSTISNQTLSESNKKVDDERCSKHNKKLEAFCLQCFEYVCLQCVISHPKEHDLKTIQEAIGYFKQQTKKIIRFYRDMKLNYKMQRIELEKTDILNTVNQHKAKLTKVFNQIKTYMEQKQTQAISTLRSAYDIEINRIAVEQREHEQLLASYNKLVEISHTTSLKNCIAAFQESRNLFSFDKQKTLYQAIMKRDKTSAATTTSAIKSQLSRWQGSFNKFKEKVAKDIKTMLNIQTELKQKPLGPYKNGASTGNNLYMQAKNTNHNNNNNSKKDLQKFYKLENKKQNKELHISLKELDRFAIQVDQPKQSQQHFVSNSMSNTSRISMDHNLMIMYGGYTQDEDSPGIQLYGQSNAKLSKISFGSGHVKFGIINIETKVYIFGGKRDNKRISQIYVMDNLKNDLKEFGHLNKAKSGFGYCRRGTSCFVVGGNDGSILQDFEEYDFAKQEMRAGLPRLTIARDELTAALHKNQIYAIGGYNLDNEQIPISIQVVTKHRREVQFLNEEVDYCSTTSNPTPLSWEHFHRQWSLCGRYPSAYSGGYDGRNYLSTVERYNEVECRWQIVCEMIQQRCTFGLIEHSKNDGFLVFGGFAHEPLATCEMFNTDNKRCNPIEPLSSKRFMLGAIQVPWQV